MTIKFVSDDFLVKLGYRIPKQSNGESMTKYKYKLGTSVIAQSDDKKHIAMGEVTGYYDHHDNGKTYYLICNSFWLPHQIKLQ